MLAYMRVCVCVNVCRFQFILFHFIDAPCLQYHDYVNSMNDSLLQQQQKRKCFALVVRNDSGDGDTMRTLSEVTRVASRR